MRFHNQTPDRTKECGDRCSPIICKPPEDAVSPSAPRPFFTAWGHSQCLFHIKEDGPDTVTVMNAVKTSPRQACRLTFFTARSERKIGHNRRDKAQPAAQMYSWSAPYRRNGGSDSQPIGLVQNVQN